MINENTIIKKTSALYSKYGIKSVSVDDVSFMLGISKKTLYEFIENKNELIERVVENNLDAFLNKVTDKIEQDNDIFMNLCQVYLNIIKEMKKVNPSYVHDLKKYHSKQYHKIIDFRDQKLYRIVTNWIEKGIETGIFRKDLDMRLVYFNQVQKVSVLVYDSVFEYANPITAQDIYKLILNDIRGITTLKGHEIFDRDYDVLLRLK